MTAVMLPLSAMSGTLSERWGHKLVGGIRISMYNATSVEQVGLFARDHVPKRLERVVTRDR